jgi:hypothetical protein
MKTRTLLAMTASALLATTAAFADTAMIQDGLVSVDQITDGEIYRMELTDTSRWDDPEGYAIVRPEWVKVGDIEDVVLDRNGQMVGVLAEIGGFLDIGDRDVMIPLDNIRFTSDAASKFALVTNMTEAELEALPEVDERLWK